MGFLTNRQLLDCGLVCRSIRDLLDQGGANLVDRAFAREVEAIANRAVDSNDKIEFYLDLIPHCSRPQRKSLLVALAKELLKAMIGSGNFSSVYLLRTGLQIAEYEFQIDPSLASSTLMELRRAISDDYRGFEHWMVLLRASVRLAPEQSEELAGNAFNSVAFDGLPQTMRDGALSDLAAFYVNQGQIEKAIDVLGKIQHEALRAYPSILLQLRLEENKEQKKAILLQATQMVQTLEEALQRIGLLHIASFQFQLGAHEDAKHTVALLKSLRYSGPMDELGMLLNVFELELTYDPECSEITLDRMVELAKRRATEDMNQSYHLFKDIFNNIKNSQSAIRSLIAALSQSIDYHDYGADLTSLLAEAEVATLDLEAAKKNASDSRFHSSRVYFAIVGEELKTSREGAYRTADLIKGPFRRAWARFKIALLAPLRPPPCW